MRPRRLHTALVLTAAASAVLAAFAGSPYLERHASLDVAALSSAVARDQDRITPVDLATWIKDRKAGLRVLDVRPQADFDAYHVPAAEFLPLDALASARFPASDTLVVYSEDGARAAQAWVFLRALGFQRVYCLRGGLAAWLDEVMNPVLETGASRERAAAFERVAALSRYFGGTPRVGVAQAPPGSSMRSGATLPGSTAVRPRAAPIRRGC